MGGAVAARGTFLRTLSANGNSGTSCRKGNNLSGKRINTWLVEEKGCLAGTAYEYARDFFPEMMVPSVIFN